MKRPCAWCGKILELGETRGKGGDPVSHGKCDECAAAYFHPYQTRDLRAFLDDMGEPIMVVDVSGAAAAGRNLLKNKKPRGSDARPFRHFHRKGFRPRAPSHRG
jgi:hypothetical protein